MLPNLMNHAHVRTSLASPGKTRSSVCEPVEAEDELVVLLLAPEGRALAAKLSDRFFDVPVVVPGWVLRSVGAAVVGGGGGQFLSAVGFVVAAAAAAAGVPAAVHQSAVFAFHAAHAQHALFLM